MKGIDVGDVDGDKKNEVVVMDDHNLFVFKYDGEKLSFFQKIETGTEFNFLTMDVADVNRNGVAEIIVTAVVEDDLRSFILEFEEGKFKKITEKAGWFFRVLEHPKEGPVLMGQRMGSEGIPTGPIFKFIWKKKSFEKGPKLTLPNMTKVSGFNVGDTRGTNEMKVFGFTMGDIRGTGKNDIITLDLSDQLTIISEDGKIQWKSRRTFGGTNNFYDTKKKTDINFRPGDRPTWRVFINGRILVRDLMGTGVPQVIVNRNEFSSKFSERVRSFEKGEVYDLVWEDRALEINWKTREIEGYIADYQVKDVDNDGNEELAIAVITPTYEEGVGGIFSRKLKSNVYFFKLF